MVSAGATLLIATVALLLAGVNAQRDRNVTRYVAIGQQSVVRLPEQVPVKLDCRPLAVAAYGDDLNTSSIEWFRGGQLVTGDNIRRVTITETNLCLLIDSLTIASGAEDGTEAEYTCMACRNEPPAPPLCRNFTSRLVASSPPVLGCAEPNGIIPFDPDVSVVPFGCDLCVEVGQSVFLTSLTCEPETNRLPTNCTIRNPDGLTAQEIVNDFDTTFDGSTLVISNELVMNPETQAPPKFLGTWSCTCINVDGQATVETKLGSCLLPPLIDKDTPKAPPTKFPPYLSSGSRSFKIGGNDFVLVDNSFEITCNIIQGIPAPGIMWTKDGNPLMGQVNMTSLVVFVNSSNPATAAGSYRCVADNGAGTDMETTLMRLGQEIFEPPEIRKGGFVRNPISVNFTDMTADIGSDVYVIRGLRATINCELDNPGLPEANITWTRNNQPFNENMTMLLMNGGRQLSFATTMDTKDAYFCCMAENVAGADTACSNLFLRGGGPTIQKGFTFDRPVNPEVIPPSELVSTFVGGSAYAVRGSDLEVTCPVSFADPDVESFMWTYHNQVENITITVTFNMMDEFTGEEFGTTVVDGNPVTVYRSLERQTSRIVITPNRTMAFDITCAAMSPLGVDMATTNFEVYAPPVIDKGMPSILPLMVRRQPTVTQNIGSTFHVTTETDVTFDCPTSGEIPVDSEAYSWYYRGKPVMDQTNFVDFEGNPNGKFLIMTVGGRSSLTIRNVGLTDRGTVQCVAFNPAGQDVASSRLNVYDDVLIAKGSPNVTIGPSELTGDIGNKFLVPRGQRSFINCDFAQTGRFPYNESVNLPARIEWSLNGVPLDRNLFSQLHGNQLCFDVSQFNLTGVNDVVQCKSTSRISDDGVLFQMDVGMSQIMVVDPPVINLDAVPDTGIEPGLKGVRLGSKENRRIVSSGSVLTRCELAQRNIMPMPEIKWFLNRRGRTTEIIHDGTKYDITIDAAGDSTLRINNFNSMDEGRYRCMWENSVGSDTADVTLVLCPLDSQQPDDICDLIRNGSFSITLEQENPDDSCPYCAHFNFNDFGPCVPNCHKGVKSRHVECFAGSRKVSNFLCANRSMPVTAEPASEQSCADDFSTIDDSRSCLDQPKWMAEQWSMCTKTCESGIETRRVMCRIPGTGVSVSDTECHHIPKPIEARSCAKYISCGCEDAYQSCKYTRGKNCLFEGYIRTCCKSCSNLGHNRFFEH